MRRENAELKRANEVLKAATAFRLRTRSDPATVVKLVAQLRGRFGVEPILRSLGIASSTCYGWIQRQTDPHSGSARTTSWPPRSWTSAPPPAAPTAAHGCTRPAPPRDPGVTQADRTADARPRTAGRVPAHEVANPSARRDPQAAPAPDLVHRDFTAPGTGPAEHALMENFFSTLKIGLVYRNSWRTRDEAENAIFSFGRAADVIWPYSAIHPVARWSPRRVNTTAPEAAPLSGSPSPMTG